MTDKQFKEIMNGIANRVRHAYNIGFEAGREAERKKYVRCKDCESNYANMIPAGKGCSKNVELEITDDFYCGHGKRI